MTSAKLLLMHETRAATSAGNEIRSQFVSITIFAAPAPRCMTTRQYARLVSKWIANIGLDPRLFGTHSLRRTKATLIYRRTGNLRAVQLLLGQFASVSVVHLSSIQIS